MWTAAILSAGFGTRLRPLTEEIPKALVPVGDRPLLLHILEELGRQGSFECRVNLHHLSDKFLSIIESWHVKPKVMIEAEILGTAGSVAAMGRGVSGPLLVWNGDVLAEPPVRALLDSAGDGVCLAVTPRPLGQGTLGLDQRGSVVRLRGRSFGQEHQGADYMGVSAFAEEARSALPRKGCWVEDFALAWLASGKKITTVTCRRPWIDVGSLRNYLDANLAWLRKHGHSAFSEGAQLAAGVRLSQTVVGVDAQVSSGSQLTRTVVWPRARVAGVLEDCVLTEAGRIVHVAPADDIEGPLARN